MEASPDPLIQLVTTFSRSATTEHGSAIKEDELYMRYAHIFSESCGGPDEDEEEEEPAGAGGGGGGGGATGEADAQGEQQQPAQQAQTKVEEDEGASIHVSGPLGDRPIGDCHDQQSTACRGSMLVTLRIGLASG